MSDTTSPSDEYALFSSLIKPLDLHEEFEDQQKHIRHLLFRYLNTKTVVALVGSGCSKSLGYPNWKEFAIEVLDRVPPLTSGVEKKPFERFRNYLESDTLPQYVTYRTIFGECERHCEGSMFRDEIQKIFLEKHNAASDKRGYGDDCYKPLIDLEIRRFITTNYDLELEMALMEAGKITGAQLFSKRAKTPSTTPAAKANKIATAELFGGNYDIETLKQLPKQLQSSFPSDKSFTQLYECREQLSRFSLARNEASEYMVFHCHGRIDDMSSCVITEEDYRHWYLRDDEDVKARQQAMDVLLSSNPLLLIGYSMGDPEFMQLLQFVHANRLNDPNRSPLFVLLYIPETYGITDGPEGNKILGDICVSLHARYGAYVIPIRQGRETTAQKLVELKRGWLDWWQLIQAKPLVKTFFPNREESYYHYRSKQLDKTSFIVTEGYENLERELIELIKTPPGKKRFAVLTGQAGAGKTWSTQWFAMRFSNGELGSALPLARNVYFWSSYYTNDLFTGIKRALKFFGQVTVSNPVRPEDMLAKFKTLLDTKDALLIFDGVERLLQPVDNVADGKAVNQDVTRFFNIIGDSKKAFVILTSRQWPTDILSAKDSKYERWKKRVHLRAPKCLSSDLKKRQGSVYQRITDGDCSSLCSLLEGHIYCLSLIEKMLDGEESPRLDDLVRELLRGIVSTPTDRRPERVIRVAIEKADKAFKDAQAEADARQPPQEKKQPWKGNVLLKFLERMALFMNPIEKQVLKVCLALAIKETNNVNGPNDVRTMCLGKSAAADDKYEPSDAEVESVITHLSKRSLLLEVKFNDTPDPGYTVHPLLQKYVRKRLHHSVFSSHPSMILPGYTSAFEVVDPGSHAVGLKVSQELFDELCCKAERASSDNKRVAALYCRSAFGVLRSRFCANTVSRWGNYQAYIQMVYRLYDTARLASAKLWYHAEYETKTGIINQPDLSADSSLTTLNHLQQGAINHLDHSTDPPLYIDELAWLFNELGFSAFSLGNMLDAMVIWQQGLEVNALVDGTSNGVYRFQSYFNLGVGFIHLGNLHHASTYLKKAIQIAHEMEDKMLRGRVLGYIALLEYLQGNLDDADRDFEQACRQLKGNARGLSVFLTHHGEMLLKKGDLERAQRKIDNSRSLAEGAYFPDLVAYARLAEANLLRQQKKYTEAQHEYSAALEAAKKIGLRRLEAAVLSGMSRWAYDLNDSEIARQKAFAALKVANETSLGLHQTLGLLTLGKALLIANQRGLGVAYLKSARLMAKEQGYFLREAEAETELRQIGEETNE
jgi:tetratricopeptide (TPR) repeat protein